MVMIVPMKKIIEAIDALEAKGALTARLRLVLLGLNIVLHLALQCFRLMVTETGLGIVLHRASLPLESNPIYPRRHSNKWTILTLRCHHLSGLQAVSRVQKLSS